MDNVIHTLCGLALARAGVDKLGPWSTGTLLVASNIPDLGGVMLLWGDQQNYLRHHPWRTRPAPAGRRRRCSLRLDSSSESREKPLAVLLEGNFRG